MTSACPSSQSSGAQEATVEEAVTAVDVARTELLASKADLLAIIVGRAEPELRDEIEKSVKRGRRKPARLRTARNPRTERTHRR